MEKIKPESKPSLSKLDFLGYTNTLHTIPIKSWKKQILHLQDPRANYMGTCLLLSGRLQGAVPLASEAMYQYSSALVLLKHEDDSPSIHLHLIVEDISEK